MAGTGDHVTTLFLRICSYRDWDLLSALLLVKAETHDLIVASCLDAGRCRQDELTVISKIRERHGHPLWLHPFQIAIAVLKGHPCHSQGA